MEINRNVIQDLLPLYLSGEASPDTVALVTAYLERDSELAGLVKELTTNGLGKVPKPLRKEVEMEAYQRANQTLIVRTAVIAVFVVLFMCSLLSVASFLLLVFRSGIIAW